MKKYNLATAVLCTIASVGFVMSASAEETAKHNLPEVVVEADRTLPGDFVASKGNAGLLGEVDVMDSPFSQVHLTEKTISTFGGPNQPLQSILVNNPSVRVQGTNLHNDFSIRGIKGNGTSSYLNGIPGLMTQFSAPTFFVEYVQFISGPNSGLNGIPCTYETSAAGGIVNFVSKKADAEPITRYKQTFSGKGSLGEYLDIGRRFGKDGEWGVRVNTELLNGETAIDKNKIEAQGIYANIDHVSANSKTNLLAGYRHLDIKNGMRWFSMASTVTKVPKAPDASKNYSFDGMEKEAEGYVLALNHEQKLAQDWQWFMDAGMMDNKLQKNISGQGSRLEIQNNQGDVKRKIFSTQTITKNYFLQGGVKGKFNAGAAEHDVVMAVQKAWHSSSGAKDNYNGKMGTVAGNIYTGVYGVGFQNPTIETKLNSKDQYWGISIADTIKIDKAQILVGLHKHTADVTSYSSKTRVESDAVSPTYGLVYKPDEHVSLYANHAENFDKGEVVGSAYANKGEILSPAKTKQNEIGIKYANAGYVLSLGAFDITQANNMIVSKNGADYYLQDGQNAYKGIELSANGKLADKWNIMGGFMYLGGEQENTQGGKNDGKTINGAAKWNAVAALEYNADDNFSVVGRALYTGKADINNEALTVPSYITYDLGVNYKTKLNSTPVTLSAMCYNLTDKNYWTAYSNNLLLNNPRTFMLSAQFDI